MSAFQPSCYSLGDAYGGAKTMTDQCADAQAKVELWKGRIGKKLYPKAQQHVNEWSAKATTYCAAAQKEQSQLDNLLTPDVYDTGAGEPTSEGGLPLPLLAVGAVVLLGGAAFILRMRKKAA